MGRFREKHILITGTSRGIGRALADFFAAEGAVVYAVSRTPVLYEYLNIIPVTGDINKYDSIIRQIDENNIKIDILINNAGTMCYKQLLEAEADDYDLIFSTNVISTVLFTSQIAKRMINQHIQGVIVNTLSFAADIPSAGSGIYAASKAALASLTRTQAAELAPYGIRVNGYSPGVIETEMTEPALRKNRKRMTDAIALHRTGTTEDAVRAVAFLSSDDSSYITGINLDVSGGKYIVQNAEVEWSNFVSETEKAEGK